MDPLRGVGAWCYAKPGPVSFHFGWTAVATVAVIGATALAFDFMAFRTTELKKRQESISYPLSAHTNGNKKSGRFSSSVNGVGDDRVDWRRSWVQVKRVCVLTAWIACALVCDRLGMRILARISAVTGSFVALLPHLLRSSKYRRDKMMGCVIEEGDRRRGFNDKLVWTSLIYILPVVYGLHAHQYGIAVLQLMTTIGSTSFHLARETKFFNLDNVFATSLLCTTLWGLYLSIRRGVAWYATVNCIGGPFAIFCIVQCGMPGIVCCHPSGKGLCRKSNPDYDLLHTLWHLSSGLGTLASIYFFESNFPGLEAGGGWFYFFPDVPIVPTVALVFSGAINLYGNCIGLMPIA